jgi:transcriptional antiterminator Rof (Rho-off)
MVRLEQTNRLVVVMVAEEGEEYQAPLAQVVLAAQAECLAVAEVAVAVKELSILLLAQVAQAHAVKLGCGFTDEWHNT